MTNYYLGITGNRSLSDGSKSGHFWCVPIDAKKGDIVLLYFPRIISAAKQGIFAEAVLDSDPDPNGKDNCLCGGYKLLYVPISITKRFNPTLTAKEIKREKFFKDSMMIRKNFQFTSLKLDDQAFKKLKELIEAKMDRVKGI